MGIVTRLRNAASAQLLGDRFVARGPAGTQAVALTFDDGPHPEHTPRILDLLEANGIRGTFFLVGDLIDRHPELVRRMVGAGHEIGNHSMHHRAFAAMPIERQIEEIEAADRLLTGIDGRPRHWFRPPQGRVPLRLLVALARRRHPLAMWTLDSFDYRGDGVDAVLQRFEERPVRTGDVVLFHDDNAHTVAAIARLLPAWRAQGPRFGTLSELAPALSP